MAKTQPCYSQTINKVGRFCGRGLVDKENGRMKSLSHDTRHLSRHDSDDKKWQTIRTPTLSCCFIFLTAKQHKKRNIWVRRWLLNR